MDRIKMFCDTETGGLPSLAPREYDRFMGWAGDEPIFRFECNPVDYSDIGLTQIAAVPFQLSPETYEPQIMGPAYTAKLRPVPGLIYDPEALKISGDTLEGLQAEGIGEDEAYEAMIAHFKHYLGPENIWWTGELFAHFAEFDFGMLTAFERRVLGYDMTGAMLHDAKGQALRGLFSCTRVLWANLKGLEYHAHPMANLAYIAKQAGIEKPQDHQADTDCIMGIGALSYMRKIMEGKESGYSKKPKDMYKHYQTGEIVVHSGDAMLGEDKYVITYPIGQRGKQTLELSTVFHGKEAGESGKPVRKWQKMKPEVTSAPAEIAE